MKHLLIAVSGILIISLAQLTPSVPSHTGTAKQDIANVEKLDKSFEQKKEAERILTLCSDYINKYDWDKSVAYNVMMAESNNNPDNLNDTPSTGDFSVGCFQVNLLGSNLGSKYNLAVELGYKGQKTRQELREWLREPNNNVAIAHLIYQKSGNTFIKDWGATTCKYKVRCY